MIFPALVEWTKNIQLVNYVSSLSCKFKILLARFPNNSLPKTCLPLRKSVTKINSDLHVFSFPYIAANILHSFTILIRYLCSLYLGQYNSGGTKWDDSDQFGDHSLGNQFNYTQLIIDFYR